MTAVVIIMPVVPRRTLGDPAWREQYERECAAKAGAMLAPPARTRPLLVTNSDRILPVRNRLIALASQIRRDVGAQFDLDMAELQQAFADSEGGS